MLIQGQHWWFDCFFTTAVNCGVSLLMLFVLHIDLNNTCTMTSRVARRVKAKLRGGRKPLRGKNEMTLRSTVGDWSQGAVEQHAGSGLAAPLKMSCVTETTIMWRPLLTSGRECVLVEPMNVKRVVAEKQRACHAKMHDHIKDIAERNLLLSIGTNYQTLSFFPASLFDIVHYFFSSHQLTSSERCRGVIACKLSNIESRRWQRCLSLFIRCAAVSDFCSAVEQWLVSWQ